MKPWLLDAFCGAGGATKGYQDAGFRVFGVDINPQPNYCGDDFIQADAVELIRDRGHRFIAISTSPPCQAYSATWRLNRREHASLIPATRDALLGTGRPYVIENVEGARDELIDPVMICGAQWPELRMYRHRLFESNFPLVVPPHPEHKWRQAKMGRPVGEGEFIQMVGNFSNPGLARQLTGCHWMTREELAQCIPPAYSHYVGTQLMTYLEKL